MSKQRKSKFHNFLGTFQSFVKIISLNYLTIVPGIMTIISGIATIVVTLSGRDNVVLLIISLTSSVVTLLGFFINVIKGIIRQNRIIIHPYTNEEISSFFDSIHLGGDYRLLVNGKSRLLYSMNENEYIKNTNLNIPFSFKHNASYSIPDDVKKNAYRIFKDYLSKKKFFYDSKKIRLNNDIKELMNSKDNAIVQLSKTTYFNSICTNEISMQEMRYDDEVSYCFDGFLLVKSKGDKNKDSRIYPLSESQCSNHIGISTLVITSDDFIILTRQGKRNLISSDKYIVTASGSLDLHDRKKCNLFGELIKKGMNRELCEECNIKKDNIIDTNIIGYGRLLERGGKPEFFGITRVNITADKFIDNAKRGKEVKKEYVSDFIKIKHSKNSINNIFEDFENKGIITIQLAYYVKVLLKE